LASQNNVSYAAHGANWLIASWVDSNKQIVYQKEFIDPDVVYYMVFTCQQKDKATYEPVITHLEKTFMRHGERGR